jgi:hypothetical protein
MQAKWMASLVLGIAVAASGAFAQDKKEDHKHDHKAEHKHEEAKGGMKGKVVLPEGIAKAWAARFKDATDVKVEAKNDSFEITAKDQWNEKIRAVYGTDGKLWEESDRKLPLASVPPAVVETAKKWAPDAKWREVAEVETKNGKLPVYEITGDLNGKTIEAEINEDGTVKKADKLETKKAEKAEAREEKEEKKEGKEVKKAVAKEEKH